MRKIAYFSLLALFIFSCGKKNRFSDIDLSNSPVQPVEIQRFDIDFFKTDTNNVARSLAGLREKYGNFTDLYLTGIIGNLFTNENEVTREFLTHPAYRKFYSDVETTFTDVTDLEKDLTTAFSYIKHYFPDIEIPQVYTHVSGFGDIIVVTDSILSISLDYYLGSDYQNYQYVDGIHSYMTQNMYRKKIPSDAIFWWLTTEFPDFIEVPQLLDNIIYYGKIMYLTEVAFPKEKKETLMGYTTKQWDWVKANEAQMWNYIMENKHLFSTETLVTAKYINPAPFTSFFPNDSPGRTGIWIGWQIIRSYMDKNKDVTLPELMNNHDAQNILEKSGYRP
jgi:hypothetical protein